MIPQILPLTVLAQLDPPRGGRSPVSRFPNTPPVIGACSAIATTSGLRGAGFFAPLAISDPVMATHRMGKNIKFYGADHVVWGTDCLWWGSPQWCIDALKRFQICDEMCDKFGTRRSPRKTKRRFSG